MAINPRVINNSLNTLASLSAALTLGNALARVPVFSGQNKSLPLLRDFLADVRAAAIYVPNEQQAIFTQSVLGKLQGPARDSICGKNIRTIDDLIKHLKVRFAPGKTYSYFLAKLQSLQRSQNQTCGDIFDKINILLAGVKGALKDTQETETDDNRDANQLALTNMMKPI